MSLTDEEFLEILEDLRIAITATEVERYNHFVNNSTDGHACKYALASLKLFQQKQQRQLLTDKLRALSPLLNQ